MLVKGPCRMKTIHLLTSNEEVSIYDCNHITKHNNNYILNYLGLHECSLT